MDENQGQEASPFINSGQAATRLGVTVWTVYDLLKQGKIRGHRVGRKVVVDARSVEDYKAGNQILPPVPPSPAPLPFKFKHLKF